jgi:glycosyltransferase involved in cell wall biosynthesis
MSGPLPLTVTVITLNEGRNLDRCLRSVAWAAERLVVDSGSEDATLAIAERHGARIVTRPWPGYVEQKNFAVGQASHDWVLSLDADEWLTDESAEEVRAALVSPRADAFAFRRVTSFSGAFVPHVWARDWQTRLFRKGRAVFAGGQVHESLRLNRGATVVKMRAPLMHLGYRSIRDYVERLNRYTDLAASSLADDGVAPSRARLFLSPPATFAKLYLLRLGCLDGVRGFVVAAGSAFYVLLKYAKLWEASRTVSPELTAAAGSTPEDPDPGAR